MISFGQSIFHRFTQNLCNQYLRLRKFYFIIGFLLVWSPSFSVDVYSVNVVGFTTSSSNLPEQYSGNFSLGLPPFLGHNIGPTQLLELTDGLIGVLEEPTDPEIINASLFYQVYPVGGIPGLYLELPLPENIDFIPTPDVTSEFFVSGLNIDLLIGLTPGLYNFAVYWSVTDALGNTTLDGSPGNPLIATFEFCIDADEDGYCIPEDCNDNDPSIYPGKTELCNGVDDNCNGDVDEDVISPYVICSEDIEIDCSALLDPLPINACISQDNGFGTVDFPDPLCGFVSDMRILVEDIFTSIHIDEMSLQNISNIVTVPGGSLGGDLITFDADVVLPMEGVGPLAGFSRFPTVFTPDIQIETAPTIPGEPIQIFDANLVKLETIMIADPDFNSFELRMGSTFGLPCPGEIKLHRLGAPGSNFNVDSFFDISYQIEWQGEPGSLLEGLGGSIPAPVQESELRLGLPFQPFAGISTALDNGTGTTDFGDAYAFRAMLIVSDGLPQQSNADPPSYYKYELKNVQVTSLSVASSSTFPGGTDVTFDGTVDLALEGFGILTGFNRTFAAVPFTNALIAEGPRTPGDPIQSFPTELIQLEIELPPGDPDFDLLRLRIGSSFGLPPSPGFTTLTDLGDGSFNVDSFFDVHYEIDFQGASGGALDGMGGITEAGAGMIQGVSVPMHKIPVDQGAATGFDQCDPDPLCFFADSPLAPDPPYVSSILRTYTCTDAAGNSSNCSYVINLLPELDTDADGTCDALDGCPLDADKTEPGTCGCGVADADDDFDGIPDCVDTCPDIYDPLQVDGDDDGWGPECDCNDNDPNINPGIPNTLCSGTDCNANGMDDTIDLSVNSGGTDYISLGGDLFMMDVVFEPCPGVIIETSNPIGSTADDQLYQTARIGTFSYPFPMLPNFYQVNLHFAEIDPTVQNIGDRVFNISIEGNPVETGFDLFLLVELEEAIVTSYIIGTNDGTLNIDFSGVSSKGALISGIDIFVVDPLDFTWYEDIDGDGFGNPASSIISFDQPPGFVADNSDCNDNDSDIYPGAPEFCDSEDNDCDGLVDENCDQCVEENFQHNPTGLFSVQTATTTQLFWKHYSDATSGCLISSQRININGNNIGGPINFAITGPAKLMPDANGNNKSAPYVADYEHTRFNSNTFPAGNTASWIPGEEYKWRVRCACIIDENLPFPDRVKNFNLHLGPWSDWDFFTNLSLPPGVESIGQESEPDKDVLTIDEVKIMPNPTEGITTVEIFSESDQIIRYNVHDLFGRKIKEEIMILANGLNYFELDISDQASGIYLLELLDEQSLITKQIVKY